MGIPAPAPPVKLFVGMISGDPPLLDRAVERLSARFGPADRVSPDYPWNHTDYYIKEMGPGLKRRFVFFRQTVSPDALSEIKRFTNDLEREWARETQVGSLRRINLDPGYLAPSKVVLATTKDFAHRIYLRDGIYAEITLIFRNKTFVPLSHTYPDFRTDEYLILFNEVRSGLLP